jgi:hypothetical protein
VDEINIKIKLKDAARFAAEMRAVAHEIDETGDAAERANRKSKRGAAGLNELKKSAKGLQSLLKSALIGTGLGVMTQLLSAGTAGAVGLAGALAPAAGLLLALPAAFTLAAQGAAVFKFGLAGVTDALGGLNGQIDPKKFAELSRPGQDFVLTLNSMKAPIKDLQRRVQEGLFPGLTKGLKSALPALHALLGPLGATGGVLGGIGSRFGSLVGSRSFAKDLADQARFNNAQLGRLGTIGLHVVNILRNLTVAARPLVSWLVRLAGGWAATADHAISAGRENGKLAGVFRVVQRTAGDVLKIVRNLGRAIFNVANLGRKNLGESLLASLVKGSVALRKWTESGKGVAKITQFFREAKPVVYAFAELLKAAVVDIFKLGTGGAAGLTGLLGKLRTETLPLVLKVTEALTTLFSLIAENVPGGTWLLTIGYLLSKLNIAGPLAKALYGATVKPLLIRAGAILGGVFTGSFETVALAGMYGIDWIKGLTGASALAKFSSAGRIAGLAFEVAFVAALGFLAFELGKKLGEWVHGLHFHFDLSRLLHGKSPLWVSENHPKSLAQQAAQNDKRLQGVNTIGRGLSYLEPVHPAAKHRVPGAAMGGLLTRGGLVEVGERGPELLALPAGAQIIPNLSAPEVAEVSRTSSQGGWGTTPIHVHSHVTLTLDSKPVAEGTSEVVAERKALA